MHALICEHYCQTHSEISKEISICKNSRYMILTEKLKMRCVTVKYAMHLLIGGQKQNNQELFNCLNADGKLLKSSMKYVLLHSQNKKLVIIIGFIIIVSIRKKAHRSCSNVNVILIVSFHLKSIIPCIQIQDVLKYLGETM